MTTVRFRNAALQLLLAALVAPSARAQTDSALLSKLSFNLTNPGGKSLAMGGAFTAIADDATAALANPATADPSYGGPVLVGLDPVLASTRDPRLLGPERLLWRQRLLAQGVDPALGQGPPTLYSSIRHSMLDAAHVDLERRETLVEVNGPIGVETTFEYPKYFSLFLFPSPEPLPGGFVEGSGELRYAQTMAFTTLMLFQMFNVLNARSDERSAFVPPADCPWRTGQSDTRCSNCVQCSERLHRRFAN